MIKITRGGIGWDKIKRWVNKLIRTKAIANLFVGEDAGLVTTGNYNSFVGYQPGYSNTNGHSNNFMGYQAGYSNTSGYYDDFMGYGAGHSNTSGYSNDFIGYRAGFLNTSGYQNCLLGYKTGYSCTTGCGNTNIGYQTGYSATTTHYSVCIGYNAGYYETVGNKLFIDDRQRADEADGRVKALIYGVFDAATANQRLSINGRLLIKECPSYADSTAAKAGGLVVGEVYKRAADGFLQVVI